LTIDPIGRAVSLPCWGGPVSAQPLAGGLSNQNVLVSTGGRRYVVRVGGDVPHHAILRAIDVAASRAAHLAGVSPAVLHAEPDVLVLDFVEGRTLTPADMRDPRNLDALVRLIQRAHRDIPRYLRGPAPLFWVFHAVRGYIHQLRDHQASPADLDDLLARSERLERAIGPIDLVFCHNDLLAANVIDDGARLWLIDWDYGGFNSPLFDLGGLASNNGFGPEATRTLLEAYFDRPVDDFLLRQAAAMTAASLLRETLWSMVSEIHSVIDFDYAAYSVDNRARFEAAFARFLELER
jgi:thiamine kinase-like enzyme